jgi:hypothetical protein
MNLEEPLVSRIRTLLSDWLLRVEPSLTVTIDGPSTRLSWNKAPVWGLRPDFYYCQTVARLSILGALCEERTGLSFTIVAGPRQCSHSRVRVLWDLRSYFTDSDSRLSISSPSTTRRATVEVFDPTSTREWLLRINYLFMTLCGLQTEHTFERFVYSTLVSCHSNVCLPNHCPTTVCSRWNENVLSKAPPSRWSYSGLQDNICLEREKATETEDNCVTKSSIVYALSLMSS